ncbi:MAG: hypothetical protein J6R42_00860 [Clostridia bacterium]|nr:hypothetical protein [Clostridia bacterium]
MQCFANVWVDVLLGCILALYVATLFCHKSLVRQILAVAVLLFHVGLTVLMLCAQYSLEELLALLLLSATVGLAIHLKGERGKRHDV